MIIAPSRAYENYKTQSLWQLAPYRQHHFTVPLAVNYRFYFKGKMWADFDNVIASINDILEDSGIIENDRLIQKGSYEVFTGQRDWRVEIEIEVLT